MNDNTCNAFSKVLACSKCSINIIVVIIIITIIINRQVLVLAWSVVSYLTSVSLSHHSAAFACIFTALFPSNVLSFFPSVHCWIQCLVPVENSRGTADPPVSQYGLHAGIGWPVGEGADGGTRELMAWIEE